MTRTCSGCDSFFHPTEEEILVWKEKGRAGSRPGACWVNFLRLDDPRHVWISRPDMPACGQYVGSATPPGDRPKQAALEI